MTMECTTETSKKTGTICSRRISNLMHDRIWPAKDNTVHAEETCLKIFRPKAALNCCTKSGVHVLGMTECRSTASVSKR